MWQASRSHLICLGINTFPLRRNRQQGKVTSYSAAASLPLQSSVRPCLEYALHLWRWASKLSLITLDVSQRRAIRLIDDPTVSAPLNSLAYRRNVSALFLVYRNDHDMCPDELNSVIHPKACFALASTLNIPSRLNSKSVGPLHWPIRSFPWLQGTGTLFRSASLSTFISFKTQANRPVA